MNCNVYFNQELYKKLERYRKAHHKSRNSIITTALTEWLNTHKDKGWPKSFFEFPAGTKGLYPDVSELRKDLVPPKEVKF